MTTDLTPRLYVHHREGEIIKVEFTNCPTSPPNTECVPMEGGVGTIYSIRNATHRVSDGKVVPRTGDDLRAAQLPTQAEVNAAVFQELQATDFTQLPDTKFTDAQRSEWAAYRKALRDLSKVPGHVDRIMNWPSRPDGVHGAAHLRDRVR